ncbi:TlmH [Prochlorococcus phage P-HM2]|uniref:TlmH n=1 Tax=Prochlorococcus phage P-HM2 TaxID=445696 RepID=E3ST17_9CAUD|nr:TlmH [Prochlorococcus phage P-HM2]ADO99945.1 TlmH [Prochlorococcus phage P-HM2]
MRKIWQEETLESLSSYRNLRDRHKEIIPEIIKFVEVNQPILSEWILDQWVEDRNLGRVQLWEGDWRVIPMPLNPVGTTATEEDFELSEMVSFVELFNTTVEKVQEVLPKLTESMMQLCPIFYDAIQEDVDGMLLKSCTISKLSPGTKINPHAGDIDSLRLHFPVIEDEGAWLSVRGRKRTWKVGELFAFHDNDKHWAQHNGTHDRIVVIMDYALSQLEKKGIFIEKWEEEPAI